MSRDEAIRILKNFSLCGVYHQLIHMNDTDSEAISMAIKALEQPEPCDDAVGRQAVIDAIQSFSCFGYIEEKTEKIVNALKELPSVVQPEPCGDAVSRKAAIKCCTFGRTSLGLIDELRRLPSVTPKQRWIPVSASEKLPDYGEPVLTWDGHCYCVEKRIPYIRDEGGEPISSNWWVSDEYDEYESDYYPNLRDGACIAWMPLPEPWKGKKE